MDGLNTVPVLAVHLDEIRSALAHCEGLLTAMDLQNEYKAMTNLTRPSRLTLAVRAQLDRVEGYLTPEAEDVPQE